MLCFLQSSYKNPLHFDVKKITLLEELCEKSVKNYEEKKQAISKVIEIACHRTIFCLILVKIKDW